jgi:hypothetical protein
MGRGVRRELPLGIVNQILTKLARDVARKLKIVVTHWNETSEDSPWSIRVESGCNIATIMKCQSIVERQRNGQNVRPVDVKFIRRIVAHAVNGSETSVWKMRKSMLDNQEWANEDYSVIFFRLVRVSAYADAIVLGSTPFCKVKLLVEHAKQLGYVIANKSEPFVDQITEGPASILPPSVFDGGDGADGPETCFGGKRTKRVVLLTEDAKIERIAKLEETIKENGKKCYPVYVTRDGNKSGENRYCLAMSMMTTKQSVPMEVRGVQLREERIGSGGGVVLYRPLETMRSLMYEVSSKRHVFLDKVGKWNEARDSLLNHMDAVKTGGYDEITKEFEKCYLDNNAVTTMSMDELKEHSDLVNIVTSRVQSNTLLVKKTKSEDNLIETMETALKEVKKVYDEYTKEVRMTEVWSPAITESENAKTTYKNGRTAYIEKLKKYVTNASGACASFLALQTATRNQRNLSEALGKLNTETIPEATRRVKDAEQAATTATHILDISEAETKKAEAELFGQQNDNARVQIRAKHTIVAMDEIAAKQKLEYAKAALESVGKETLETITKLTEANLAVDTAKNARGTPNKPAAVGSIGELGAYKAKLEGIQAYLKDRTTAIEAHIQNNQQENSKSESDGTQNSHVSVASLLDEGEEFRIEVTQRDPVFFAVQVSGELFRLVDVDVSTRPGNFRKKTRREEIEKKATNATTKVTAEEKDYTECIKNAKAYFELHIGNKNIDPSSVNRWNLSPLMPLGPASGSGFGFTKPDVTRLLIVPYGLSVIGDPKGTEIPLYDMTVFLHRSGIYKKTENDLDITCAWCGTKAADKKGLEELKRKYAPRAQCKEADVTIIGGLGSLCNAGNCHAAVASVKEAEKAKSESKSVKSRIFKSLFWW